MPTSLPNELIRLGLYLAIGLAGAWLIAHVATREHRVANRWEFFAGALRLWAVGLFGAAAFVMRILDYEGFGRDLAGTLLAGFVATLAADYVRLILLRSKEPAP